MTLLKAEQHSSFRIKNHLPRYFLLRILNSRVLYAHNVKKYRHQTSEFFVLSVERCAFQQQTHCKKQNRLLFQLIRTAGVLCLCSKQTTLFTKLCWMLFEFRKVVKLS